MPAELENFEEKSRYDGEERERLQILKTIIAIANSGGGQILIREVTAGLRALDSAALDGFVNSYVEPQLYGISSEHFDTGELRIFIPDSENAPHIVTRDALYKDDKNRQKWPLHRGQVWVRHGSQNETANGDDMHRLTQKRAGRILEEIGVRVQQPEFVLDMDDASATAVRLGGDSGAPRLRVNPEDVYHHTRRSLSEELDKPIPWISKAVKKLGLEISAEWAYSERNAAGNPIFWRYSDDAREILLQKLEDQPDWDP